jgi:hypothetical protein
MLDPSASLNTDGSPRSTPATTPPTPPPGLHERRGGEKPELSPLIIQTASAARWRRRENNLSNSNFDKFRGRANSELVLQVAVMEEVHGVDVSWLHHSNKGIS